MIRFTKLSSLLLLFTFTLSAITVYGLNPDQTAVTAANSSALSDCVFFGDSTTYGLHRYNTNNDGRFGKNYYTLQDSQIWTPADGTFYLGNVVKASVLIDKESLPLADACRKYTPQKLILTVGINGLGSWNEVTFSSCYARLIETIRTASPETQIYLQSVYPIAPKALEKLPNFSNAKIDLVNTWIKTVAEQNALSFLNTATVLKDENGNLKESYHNGDGLHLSTSGFNAMLEYVEKEIERKTV